MGLGDEVMMTARVKKTKNDYEITYGKKPWLILPLTQNGTPYWNPVFDNNPNIPLLSRSQHWDYSDIFIDDNNIIPIYQRQNGYRHYVDSAKSIPGMSYAWKPWDIEPGEIYFSQAEKDNIKELKENKQLLYGTRKLIIVEPAIKTDLQRNKEWPEHYWIEVIEQLKHQGHEVYQFAHPYMKNYQIVEALNIDGIRHMLCALSIADAIVSIEGGLHHCAAALGIPGVVIFGGFISPEITGYKIHRNLTHATEFCGIYGAHCPHCAAEMEKIKPDEVITALTEVLGSSN